MLACPPPADKSVDRLRNSFPGLKIILFDSYSTGNKVFSPEEAYRFAKGEAVTLPNGTVFQRKRPLDFLAVTDKLIESIS